MNSVSFFYNIFTNQEFILKLNTLDSKKMFQFQKCILFKPVKLKDDAKELQNVANDLRYILEFLTNTKVNKAINDQYICKIKVNKNKAYELFLYFTYLIFTRYNFILETKGFESDYPVLQKLNKVSNLANNKSKNYFDIKFSNGINLTFLSDNEYVSWLSVNFYIRFIFKKTVIIDQFFELKQYLYMSLLGFKFILLKRPENKNKNKNI